MRYVISTIVVITLVLIIAYFYYRIRTMMRDAPGAKRDMSTKELIKNWQQQKTEEQLYQEDIRQEAKLEARDEIRNVLKQKYKDEEIQRATGNKGDALKNKLKSGLGIDVDSIASDERMDRLIGKRTDARGVEVPSTNIFDRDKLKAYSAHGNIDSKKIKGMSSDGINWNQGTSKALKTTHTFRGVEEAIRRDGDNVKSNANKVKRRLK